MVSVRSIMSEVCHLVDELVPEVQRLRYEITWKTDGSPVTKADLLVEEKVRDHLTSQLGRLVFVGEESSTTEVQGTLSQQGWTAVLDPIDGTENFCSGLKEWGVSLSLWHAGEHAGSLLLLPELGERLMTGDVIDPVESRIVGLSSSLGPEILEELARGGEARITGCAVYNLFNVITGRFRRFVNPRGAHSWDLLAGVQLALEHDREVLVDGGTYHGEFLEAHRKYRVDVWN